MTRLLIARLHAARELDLLLCRQQGNTADFLEIHADRIIERNPLGDGDIDLDICLGILLIDFISGIEPLIAQLLIDMCIVNNLYILIAEALV